MCRFITLREGKGHTPVAIQDVIYLQACRAYTNIFIINGSSSTQCGSLSHWYERVKGSGLFLRIDRSYLVNYTHVLTFFNSGYVLLKDKHTQLPLSQEGYMELLLFFV